MHRLTRSWLAPIVSIGIALGTSSAALAQASGGDTKTAEPSKKDKNDAPAPDNTKKNRRERSSDEPAADQQKNNKSDVQVTAEIRRAVVADKSLSTYAHNVKIIAKDGMVTLKGPVHSEAEKTTIEQKAAAVVGQANVTNQIEVKP